MKNNQKTITILIIILLNAFSQFSCASVNPDFSEKDFAEKQKKAIKLINNVGMSANSPSKNVYAREDAEYAFNGFIARFQTIKENHEFNPNNNYHQDMEQLEQLIQDVRHF